ncbi:MAG: hypothetical protein HZA54_10915 [Planctomycetes bacterium]|nr:hypothetical protein [Planctomycetota bacterium]
MPVALLLVEGGLDAELLTPVLAGRATVLPSRSGKGGLALRTRLERAERANAGIGYLRDRDFDSDPPADRTRPSVDREDRERGSPLGWRWCRHEIENYLLDPAIVVAARGGSRPEYESALVQAALRIRHYQVARWVVGTARRGYPPGFELATRPAELTTLEIALPTDLSVAGTAGWARGHLDRFRGRIEAALGREEVEQQVARLTACLPESLLSIPEEALVWCSGKDLLAALQPWLHQQAGLTPGMFRSAIRDWMRARPAEVLSLLPEWAALVELMG